MFTPAAYPLEQPLMPVPVKATCCSQAACRLWFQTCVGVLPKCATFRNTLSAPVNAACCSQAACRLWFQTCVGALPKCATKTHVLMSALLEAACRQRAVCVSNLCWSSTQVCYQNTCFDVCTRRSCLQATCCLWFQTCAWVLPKYATIKHILMLHSSMLPAGNRVLSGALVVQERYPSIELAVGGKRYAQLCR